jgi:hypothetical protein
MHRRARVTLGIVILGFVVAISAESPTATSRKSTTRVRFPADYRTGFTAVRSSFKADVQQVGTTFLNTEAATVSSLDQLPYPAGSVVVFEWCEPVFDAEGLPSSNQDGTLQKGRVVRVDVMERQPGFGETYGAARAGEWEFASYQPDGHGFPITEPIQRCAECHQKAASRDFIFRGRFPPLSASTQP